MNELSPSQFLNTINRRKGNWYQSVYQLKHPEKYIGKTKPFARSSWESKVFSFCDNNSQVIKWGSEILSVPYKFSLDSVRDQKIHHYYVDIFAIIKENDGSINKYAVEIKPKVQTLPPKKPKRMTPKSNKNYMYNYYMWVKNQDKWKAVQQYCDATGIKFKLITEENFNFI